MTPVNKQKTDAACKKVPNALGAGFASSHDLLILPTTMTCRILFAALLLAFGATLQAAPPPELTALQQQYAFAIAERVTSPYETGLAALNEKFLTALTNAGAEAKKAGKLPEVLALNEDKKLIEAGQPLPEQDDEETPESLKKLRGIYRSSSARLTEQRAAAQAALLPAYAANLQTLEATLTKADRLDEATAVMAYRKTLATDSPVPPPAAAAATPLPMAAKDGYTNSLGMKFVPVKGTKVMFCIHEARYQDYAAYAAAVPDVDGAWKNLTYLGYTPLENKEQHPAVHIGWEDAKKFCEWLSKKEGKTYRLPTDEEWSIAVGLGRAEKRPKGTTPAMLGGQESTEFPWGGDYPPKTKDQAGNYGDASRKAKAPINGAQYLEDYDDGFPTTAPVMSYKPNKFGLYDMGGNMWEWCDDWYDDSHKDRTMRGAAFLGYGRGTLLSSQRGHALPTDRNFDYGFRPVLVMPER